MAADAWRVWTGPSWLQRLSDVWGHASAWRIFWHHGPVGARSPSSPSARIPDRRIRGFNDCIESKAAVVAEPRSPYHTSGGFLGPVRLASVSYTHLRAHETGRNLVCRLLLEKKKK